MLFRSDVTAERPGHAILKLTYTDMLDENIIHEFEADIWVEKDLYHLNIWYEDENDAMPLKSEKIAHVSLNHQWAYSDEDCGGDEVRDFNLKVVPDEDGNLYKQDVIDVAFEKDENGNWIIKITSKDVEDWTRICVQASIKDENGNEQVVADSEFSVDVQDNLLVIGPWLGSSTTLISPNGIWATCLPTTRSKAARTWPTAATSTTLKTSR